MPRLFWLPSFVPRPPSRVLLKFSIVCGPQSPDGRHVISPTIATTASRPHTRLSLELYPSFSRPPLFLARRPRSTWLSRAPSGSYSTTTADTRRLPSYNNMKGFHGLLAVGLGLLQISQLSDGETTPAKNVRDSMLFLHKNACEMRNLARLDICTDMWQFPGTRWPSPASKARRGRSYPG